jgi:hypothetical protein
VEQYFSLTTKQPQPAYKLQKQPAQQGEHHFLIDRKNHYSSGLSAADKMISHSLSQSLKIDSLFVFAMKPFS